MVYGAAGANPSWLTNEIRFLSTVLKWTHKKKRPLHTSCENTGVFCGEKKQKKDHDEWFQTFFPPLWPISCNRLPNCLFFLTIQKASPWHMIDYLFIFLFLADVCKFVLTWTAGGKCVLRCNETKVQLFCHLLFHIIGNGTNMFTCTHAHTNNTKYMWGFP